MKTSIRKKVTLSFVAVMVVCLVVIGLVEALYTDDVYDSNKQKVLVESWNMIDQSGGKPDDTFRKYCQVNALTYSVTDVNLVSKESNADNGKEMARRLFGNVLGMEDDKTNIIEQTDSYRLIRIQDRFSEMEYLELWGRLNDGCYYIVSTPMQSIAEAARISLHFYFYIGLAAVLISTIVIMLITCKLVKPVQELTALSQKMADLDFGTRYTSGGTDEIGELGKNFNVMSDKLQQAVGELKSANVRLEKDIAEKEEIDKKRQEFIGNVSHELKTPIALIQGYAEGLKENVNDDPESRDFYCDVIIDEATKMNKMVRQLLTLNHLESGADMVTMERFDLTELIRGVLQHEQLEINNREVNVIFDVTEPIYVWGEEFKIEEVVTNYVTNALHHVDERKIVEIKCEEKDGIVTTTVFNTGKPIPQDSLDRIWEKFYKVDKAHTRAYGGSGIGLSIVHAIMDQHQQTCSVQNYEDGVAFSFTLESKTGL
uniref:HAMP domain-containing sensor histidine kinase n=1 Tax=Eubacterium cellulosolvens TaxID=29322 RepID=UPI000488A0DF|nr:HAMP domain-containing sensor histidine kinase [[Eubacterium] cellulosolvens]